MIICNKEKRPSSRVLKLRLMEVYRILCNKAEDRPVTYKAPHHIYELYKQEIEADEDGVIRLKKITMEIVDGNN